MKTNFHTHTFRCGHASGLDYEYVEAAIEAKIKYLGFSDHSPWPNVVQPTMRMEENLLDNYAASIKKLKSEYESRIKIELGLECEYFKEHISWLNEQKEKHGLSYMIFGNHFEGPSDSSLYFGACKGRDDILKYTKMCIEGMQSGLFDWLAHPDLFTKSYPEYDDACKDAAKQICKAAKSLKMPLEYNLCGVRMSRIYAKRGIMYPYPAFWEEAAMQGCTVLISFDAHNPNDLNTDKDYQEAKHYLTSLDLTILETPKCFNC